jgi:hypothetical protein
MLKRTIRLTHVKIPFHAPGTLSLNRLLTTSDNTEEMCSQSGASDWTGWSRANHVSSFNMSQVKINMSHGKKHTHALTPSRPLSRMRPRSLSRSLMLSLLIVSQIDIHLRRIGVGLCVCVCVRLYVLRHSHTHTRTHTHPLAHTLTHNIQAHTPIRHQTHTHTLARYLISWRAPQRA